MQNKLFKRVLTGVLSSALVIATATPAYGALVPTEGKKKVVKSMAIGYIGSDGSMKDVAKNDEVKIDFPSNAKDANYVAKASFGVVLEGKGAGKGVVVKVDGKKVANGVDAFDIDQAAAGEAGTKKVQVISKAKTKKGKKLKTPFSVSFAEKADWTVATDLKAEIDKKTLGIGETAQITATVTPEGALVEYASLDEAVATVDDKGVVTAVGEGSADILVCSGDKIETITVTVTKEAAAVEVKGVSLSNTTPKVGDTINAIIDPADATNVASYQWYTGS